MSLTGHKDTDYKLLMDIDDRELGMVCQVNKKVNEICNDDAFWFARIIEKLYLQDFVDNVSKLKDFLEFDNYKELYIYLKTLGARLKYSMGYFSGGNYSEIEEKIAHAVYPDFINRSGFKKQIKRQIFKHMNDVDENDTIYFMAEYVDKFFKTKLKDLLASILGEYGK